MNQGISRKAEPASSPKFEAFGELKTLPDWLKDSRCQVGSKTLSKRIFRGWTLETSLSRPSTRESVASQ